MIRAVTQPNVLETSHEPSSGIDFGLSEQQRAIQATARDFARQEVDPIVDEYDEAQKYPREVGVTGPGEVAAEAIGHRRVRRPRRLASRRAGRGGR